MSVLKAEERAFPVVRIILQHPFRIARDARSFPAASPERTSARLPCSGISTKKNGNCQGAGSFYFSGQKIVYIAGGAAAAVAVVFMA
jgi:hypothetical protein